MTLLHWADDQFRLGVLAMDQTHWEMVQLLNNLDQLSPERFGDLYFELVRHTAGHFAVEERLIAESNYPDVEAHQEDHRWILAKLREMETEVAEGRTAKTKAWLRDQMTQWFHRHLADFDRPLADHIKAQIKPRGGLPGRFPSHRR